MGKDQSWHRSVTREPQTHMSPRRRRCSVPKVRVPSQGKTSPLTNLPPLIQLELPSIWESLHGERSAPTATHSKVKSPLLILPEIHPPTHTVPAVKTTVRCLSPKYKRTSSPVPRTACSRAVLLFLTTCADPVQPREASSEDTEDRKRSRASRQSPLDPVTHAPHHIPAHISSEHAHAMFPALILHQAA